MPAESDPARDPQRERDLPTRVLPGKEPSAQPPSTVSLGVGDSTAENPQRPQVTSSDFQRLGRFEIRERLGGGAFGEVFRAYDPKLDREIALKVARPQRLDDPDDLERFFREARAAAQFQHPNIVPVYEVGREGRAAYLVASLVEGATLADAVKQKKFSPAEAVAVVLQLADAVHYAHLKGVFHRDIKPGNVLLDRAGTVFLTDFGLARRVEGEALQTQAGEILGTPAYMSPEQARGDSRLVDARSDLYSLGVVLYELLCGHRPFGGTVFEILSKVQQHEPASLRSMRKNIPRDLEAICLKALAKQPADRYRSVEHFAEDLQRWQQGLPVEARRINPLQRASKWVRRHPLVTAAIGLMVVGAASLVVYPQTRPAWIDVRISPSTGAQAKLGTQTIQLDDQGRGLASFPPGRYQLAVIAPDHEPQTRDVLLVRGQQNTAVVSITLEPRFGYAAVTSKPDRAAVKLKDRDGNVVATGVTPFHSPRLATGEYQAELELDLYESQTLAVAVPRGDKLAPPVNAELKARHKESENYDFLQQVKAKLDEPAGKIEFIDTPLNQVVSSLSKQFDVLITFDRASLNDASVHVDQPVTLASSGVSKRTVLDRLLTPLHLTIVPMQEKGAARLHVQIVTVEAAQSRPLVVLHSVCDLVQDGDFDSLIEEITTSIEPSSWNDVGGRGTINANAQSQALSIGQPWTIQVKVVDYLNNLRQTKLANQSKAPVVNSLDTQIAQLERRGVTVYRHPQMKGRPVSALAFQSPGFQKGLPTELPPLDEVASIVFGPNSDFTDFSFLARMPKLRFVFFNQPDVNDTALVPLAQLTQLTQLSGVGTRLGDQGLLPLANHQSLDTLHLQNSRAGDDALKTIAKLPRLRSLALQATPVTDQGVKLLVNLPHLVFLNLCDTETSDAAVDAVVTNTNLTTVGLGTQCTDAALGKLTALANLRTLMFHNSQITNAGLNHLKEIPNLNYLVFSGQQFTDEAIPHLESVPKLKSLSISNSSISRAALEKLAADKPQCKVTRNGIQLSK